MLVDVEPLYFMLTHQHPIHRFFHTYVGATAAVGLVIGLFGLVPRLLDTFGLQDLTVRVVAAVVFAGAYSHVLLDSLMHADMEPFAQFSDANSLLGAVFLNTLHGFCLLAGLVGVVVIGVRYLRKLRQKRQGQSQRRE